MNKSTKKSIKRMGLTLAAVMVMSISAVAPAMAADPTGTKPPAQDNGGVDHLPGDNKPPTGEKPEEHKPGGDWKTVDYFKPWHYWNYYSDYSYEDYYWDYSCGCWDYDYQPWYYWYSPAAIFHNFYGYFHDFFDDEKKGHEEEKGTDNKPEGKETPTTATPSAEKATV